jgi:hypothetical protein
MTQTNKGRLAVALMLALVSCALLVGTVLSLGMPDTSDPYPGPGPGKWTVFFFGPFVVLNPVYFLVLALGSWGVPEPVGLGLGLALGACWWWYLAGAAVRFISGSRRC